MIYNNTKKNITTKKVNKPFDNNNSFNLHSPQLIKFSSIKSEPTNFIKKKYNKIDYTQQNSPIKLSEDGNGIVHRFFQNSLYLNLENKEKIIYQKKKTINIPTQIKIQYIPFQKKYIQYQQVQMIHRYPVQKHYLDLIEVVTAKKVPYERTVTQRAQIRTKLNYMPQISSETKKQFIQTNKRDKKPFIFANKKKPIYLYQQNKKNKLKNYQSVDVSPLKNSTLCSTLNHTFQKAKNNLHTSSFVNSTQKSILFPENQRYQKIYTQQNQVIKDQILKPQLRYQNRKQQMPETSTSLNFKPYLYNRNRLKKQQNNFQEMF